MILKLFDIHAILSSFYAKQIVYFMSLQKHWFVIANWNATRHILFSKWNNIITCLYSMQKINSTRNTISKVQFRTLNKTKSTKKREEVENINIIKSHKYKYTKVNTRNKNHILSSSLFLFFFRPIIKIATCIEIIPIKWVVSLFCFGKIDLLMKWKHFEVKNNRRRRDLKHQFELVVEMINESKVKKKLAKIDSEQKNI